MPRIVQKSRALFAAIFASYPDLFDEEAWQQQFGFPGFDVDHISNVKNEELPAVCEFLKHVGNLPLDEAITCVNTKGADVFLQGRTTYHHWWSKSRMVSKLRITHNHAILCAGINIKAMYQVAAKKGNAKFVTLMMFGSKEAEIAESMFGRAFEDNESGCMREEFQQLIHSLILDYIECQWKNHRQAETCRLEAKGELDAMWKLFESGNGQINLKDAKKILNALEKYEKYIGWEATEQDKAALAEYEQRKGEFEQALSKAEAQEEELKKNKKSSQLLHEDLASQLESIESTRNREEAEQHDIDINPGLPSHPGLIGWEKWKECGDLGVESWSKTTDKVLAEMLRWDNGRPDEFNPFINTSLTDYWENPDYAAKIPPGGDEDNEVTNIMWHQIVGITAMVNMLWMTKLDDDGVPGILLADEVGLGKTAQMMGLLAFIMSCYRAQKLGKELPPVLAQLPYFCGRKQIPDAPHLILVPGTIIEQIVGELKRWFRPHVIDIFVMPMMERRWDEFNKAVDSSKQDKCNIVIVASHSSVSQLAHRNLWITKSKTELVSSLRPAKTNSLGYEPIWSRSFCSVIVDEAHNFRTPNAAYHGMNRIMENTCMRLIVSATPLYQSPRDLCNLARLIRLKAFIGKAAESLEKEKVRELSKMQRDVTKGNNSDDDALAVFNTNALKGVDGRNPYKRVYDANNDWVIDIQARYEGRIIRRAVTSIKYTDPPADKPIMLLNELPPYEKIEVMVSMADAEKREMDNQMSKWSSDSKAHGAVDVTDAGAFLLNYRLAVAYPQSQPDPDYLSKSGKKKFPPFKSLEEWEKYPGAKLEATLRLCKHYLSDDNASPPYIEDGHLIFPDPPAMATGDKKKRTQQIKILIFHEFPMMDELIMSAFIMNGIKILSLNGSMRLTARQQVVEKFLHPDSDVHVLLLSQDIGWTAIQEEQMIGRAHRHGQKETVYVFCLIATDTIDVLMAQHSGSKAQQLQHFFKKPDFNVCRNRKAFWLLYNCDVPADAPAAADGESDNNDDQSTQESAVEQPPAKKRKTNSKKTAKTKEVDVIDESRHRRKVPKKVPEDGNREGAPATKVQMMMQRGSVDEAGPSKAGPLNTQSKPKPKPKPITKPAPSAPQNAIKEGNAQTAQCESQPSAPSAPSSPLPHPVIPSSTPAVIPPPVCGMTAITAPSSDIISTPDANEPISNDEIESYGGTASGGASQPLDDLLDFDDLTPLSSNAPSSPLTPTPLPGRKKSISTAPTEWILQAKYARTGMEVLRSFLNVFRKIEKFFMWHSAFMNSDQDDDSFFQGLEHTSSLFTDNEDQEEAGGAEEAGAEEAGAEEEEEDEYNDEDQHHDEQRDEEDDAHGSSHRSRRPKITASDEEDRHRRRRHHPEQRDEEDEAHQSSHRSTPGPASSDEDDGPLHHRQGEIRHGEWDLDDDVDGNNIRIQDVHTSRDVTLGEFVQECSQLWMDQNVSTRSIARCGKYLCYVLCGEYGEDHYINLTMAGADLPEPKVTLMRDYDSVIAICDRVPDLGMPIEFATTYQPMMSMQGGINIQAPFKIVNPQNGEVTFII
ncbi:uncharacterized protein BT62DRAFT_924580 [Guyanagaster necrorhizus]|uniref:Helicase ATP-binding domain-containing protein n=1 Tax=Guyanagaster necrorhizus TaxID=856835 RepID=A0A9P7VET6_9AGAR|nr:uncharacterized protein BT62DRAFT_924580 [Guyanagaster necrorhizus MCA 3950]KAG7439621.1 hypothetical protein BT62DRAFT_924580 [Guyanagaster necrorhizus MCA 3950]